MSQKFKVSQVVSTWSALYRQRQTDLYEFKASLVYRVSSRTARAEQRNPILKKKIKSSSVT